MRARIHHDDVRLALDDTRPERQRDRNVRAVHPNVIIIGLSGVIARDASLDGVDTVPRRRRS